ncbi:dermonecrotic toxin StSicTox-betaIC1-like isoform X2 [Haemaphysalis longicornis]
MAFPKAISPCCNNVVALLALLHMTLLPTALAAQRPFYIIGNMVNSLYDVNVFLEDGANALQADVTFSPEGRPQYMYHGPPCDCFRTCTRVSTIEDYLTKISSGLGKFQGQVALLYLALYPSSVPEEYHHQAGADIAKILERFLWRGVSPSKAVPVLLYVSSTNQKKVFKGVLDTISDSWRDHVGFDFGGMEPFFKIGEAFAELNITSGRWLGSGNTNCLPYQSGRYERLESIVHCREGKSGECEFVDKGYAYNLDTQRSIRREIRLGLDAVITNYPSTALEVLKEGDISRLVRLADLDDSPWKRIVD